MRNKIVLIALFIVQYPCKSLIVDSLGNRNLFVYKWKDIDSVCTLSFVKKMHDTIIEKKVICIFDSVYIDSLFDINIEDIKTQCTIDTFILSKERVFCVSESPPFTVVFKDSARFIRYDSVNDYFKLNPPATLFIKRKILDHVEIFELQHHSEHSHGDYNYDFQMGLWITKYSFSERYKSKEIIYELYRWKKFD